MSQPPEYSGNPQQPGYGPPPQQPGYGGPPPQQPGYGGPPPPGGYGAPPPPPAYGPPPGPPGYAAPPTAAGYGAPAGYGAQPSQQFNVGDAFNWAWNKFSKNAAALIVSSLIYGVLIGAVAGVMAGLAFASSDTNTVTTDSYDDYEISTSISFGFLSVSVLVIGSVVLFVAGAFAASAFFAGCLDLADGKPVTIGSFFKPRNLGAVILASLLVGIVTEVGNLLCVIPGLIFAFLAYFTILFVIDRSLPVIEALKASIATVRSNIGDTLLSWLVATVVIFIGALLLGIGMIVAFPVAALIQTYAYRRLSGGSTAPLTP